MKSRVTMVLHAINARYLREQRRPLSITAAGLPGTATPDLVESDWDEAVKEALAKYHLLLVPHLPAATLRPPRCLALAVADEVEVVPFDFTRPATLAPTLRGVTGLLLVRPPAISDVRRYLLPVVRAAVAGGVEHVVFLSLQAAQ